MMNFLIGFILLSFSVMANAGDNNISMTADSTQKKFVVTLAANPTTGYQWKVVQFDKNLLTLTSSDYQKPQTQLIGAGGQMLFTFTLNKGKSYPENTKMVFKYARAWEPDSGTVKNVTVNFVSGSKK